MKTWGNCKQSVLKKDDPLYPHLTDEDLTYEIGKEQELLKRATKERWNKNEHEIRAGWLSLMGYLLLHLSKPSDQ
jgi:hypothetical protein